MKFKILASDLVDPFIWYEGQGIKILFCSSFWFSLNILSIIFLQFFSFFNASVAASRWFSTWIEARGKPLLVWAVAFLQRDRRQIVWFGHRERVCPLICKYKDSLASKWWSVGWFDATGGSASNAAGQVCPRVHCHPFTSVHNWVIRRFLSSRLFFFWSFFTCGQSIYWSPSPRNWAPETFTQPD